MPIWTHGRAADGVLPQPDLSPLEVYFEFDEPLIFRALLGINDCIFNKISERHGKSYYLACDYRSDVVDALKQGRVSVRAAFTSDAYWIVSISDNDEVGEFWRLDREEIPEKYLPDAGVPIYYWMDPAPDSLLQANAIFSMKFQGVGITHESIQLGTLKNLVDKGFSAVRALLTPPQLRNTKSSTLDYECEVAMSSFVIAVQEPVLNMRSVRRRKDMANTTREQIDEDIKRRGFVLAEKIARVAELSEDVEETAEFTAANLVVMSALGSILPDEDSEFSSIEFNIAHGGAVQRAVFDRENSEAVRAALKSLDNRVVKDGGKIVGGSERSLTVRISSFRGKQVTCRFSREVFDLIAPGGKIDLTRYVNVYGVLEVRPRVDSMLVERFEFINAGAVIDF